MAGIKLKPQRHLTNNKIGPVCEKMQTIYQILILHAYMLYAMVYLGQRYSAGGPAGQIRSAEWCEMTHEGSKTTNNIFLVG